MTATPCANDPRFTSDDPFDRAEAAEVCRGDGAREACPIRESCLAGARGRGECFGIWGGEDLTPKPPTMASPDEPHIAWVRVSVYAPAHGERPRYLAGCHCEPCTAANTAFVAQYRADHQYDPPKPDVPRAEPLSMFAEIPAVTSRRKVSM